MQNLSFTRHLDLACSISRRGMNLFHRQCPHDSQAGDGDDMHLLTQCPTLFPITIHGIGTEIIARTVFQIGNST